MLDGFADLITYVIYPAFSPGITDILPLLRSPFLASLIIALIATFSILSLLCPVTFILCLHIYTLYCKCYRNITLGLIIYHVSKYT